MEEDSGDVTAECDMWEDVGLAPHPTPSSKLTAPAGPHARAPSRHREGGREMVCANVLTHRARVKGAQGWWGKHSVFSIATEKVNPDLNPKSGAGFLRAVP